MRVISVILSGLVFLLLSPNSDARSGRALRPEPFHSPAGDEYEVGFRAVYRTAVANPQYFHSLSADDRRAFVERSILPTLDFLSGPLTRRRLGGTQRIHAVNVDWSRAEVRNGRVELPYHYSGTWIVSRYAAAQGELVVPVPLNLTTVYEGGWLKCGDSAPEHQTPSFYWYYWDPTRQGCQQREGEHFTNARVELGSRTANQSRTYPEYERMVEDDGMLAVTFAFGYVRDPAIPNPGADEDAGMNEMRAFANAFRREFGQELVEEPVLQGEYDPFRRPNLVIGRRFNGRHGSHRVRVTIVAAADVDQMRIFAKSFAHDHDDVFAWYGHSRVGGGFDAQVFRGMLRAQPDYYSVSSKYQVIHWGGCNSYSYYTLPFFQLKAGIVGAGTQDPLGSRNLDIIANGLPSYFGLNAVSAMTLARAFMAWPQRRASYQDIVGGLENAAANFGALILAAVLGDEDNAR